MAAKSVATCNNSLCCLFKLSVSAMAESSFWNCPYLDNNYDVDVIHTLILRCLSSLCCKWQQFTVNHPYRPMKTSNVPYLALNPCFWEIRVIYFGDFVFKQGGNLVRNLYADIAVQHP